MEKITMTDSTIAFIGLGLIGGSIARAIRKTRPDIRIMAYMRSRSRLEQARQLSLIHIFASMKPCLNARMVAILNAISEESTG